MKKAFLLLLVVASALLSISGFAEENDYSYLYEMSNEELLQLDAEIHRILEGNSSDETACELGVATVFDKDGNEIERISFSDIKKINEANEAKFRKEYCAKDVAFTATVKKIETHFTEDGINTVIDRIIFEEQCSVTLLYGQYAKLLEDLMPGDILSVHSQIATVSENVMCMGVDPYGRDSYSYSNDTLRKTELKTINQF